MSIPTAQTSEPTGTSPVARFHLLAELDLGLPFWRYAEMYGDCEYSFLLDSAKDPERLGRYSFLGGDPFLVFRAKRRKGVAQRMGADIEIERRRAFDGVPLESPLTEQRQAEPFSELRQLLGEFAVDYDAYREYPVPMLSGAVGYFGYEAGYFVETLPDRGEDDLALPDIYLMFVDEVLAHDHRNGRTWVSIIGRGADEATAERNATAIHETVTQRIVRFENAQTRLVNDAHRALPTPGNIAIKEHFDESAYVAAVETAKAHISAGDVFEVCMTHRFETPLVGGTAWDLYAELRRINPAPFACYLQFPEAEVVSSSPERFLQLDPNRVAESRPIKGTRPRGATPNQDEALRQDLLHSEKDRAENVMIVDLLRNDLGRVCEFGSIDVAEFMAIEPYATVFQMVSTVRGRLREGLDGIDLLAAAFPGGSMTGAPKIEAMKIIDSLEPVKRGIYSGAIGYLDFAGPLDLNIVIRTFVVKDGVCYYNAGGAIVADSDPKSEYLESLDKAKALIDALRNLKGARSRRSTNANRSNGE